MGEQPARTKQGTIIREKAAQLQAAEVLRLKAASAPAPAPAVGASSVAKLRTSESESESAPLTARTMDFMRRMVDESNGSFEGVATHHVSIRLFLHFLQPVVQGFDSCFQRGPCVRISHAGNVVGCSGIIFEPAHSVSHCGARDWNGRTPVLKYRGRCSQA